MIKFIKWLFRGRKHKYLVSWKSHDGRYGHIHVTESGRWNEGSAKSFMDMMADDCRGFGRPVITNIFHIGRFYE